MERVVLLTGGNLGPVRETLAKARERLIDRIGPEWAHSSVRASEPWGFVADTHFLNQVLVLETWLPPLEVLSVCQQIEKEFGRIRADVPEEDNDSIENRTFAAGPSRSLPENRKSYQSRTLDVDILFYGDRIINLPELIIPHPLIAERKFVLDPLREVLPDWEHPVYQKTVSRLAEDLDPKNNTNEAGDGAQTDSSRS